MLYIVKNNLKKGLTNETQLSIIWKSLEERHNGWEHSSAGRASALQAEGHRFEPCRSHLTNSFISYADVAQLAEQLICNQQVIGSSPIIGFIQFNIELYYGQIPEWPKGTDCKSAATCFDGSNPSLPITLYRVTKYYRGMEQSGSSPGS